MHVHFRDYDMLAKVAVETANCFAGALVMPNLVQPVTTVEQCLGYCDRIKAITDRCKKFTPYMTLYLQINDFFQDKDKLKAVKLLHGDCIKAFKFYSRGMTTNSDHGVDLNDLNLLKVLEAM